MAHKNFVSVSIVLLMIIVASLVLAATKINPGEHQAKYWFDDGKTHEFVGTGDPAKCVLWISDQDNAIFSVGSAELILRNLTLENRHPDGGIAVWGSANSKITLENCIIKGGRDSIWSNSGKLIVVNCVVYGNAQVGIGSESDFSVNNSIITGNGTGLASQNGTIQVSYCDLYNNSAQNFGNGIVQQINNVFADPMFVDAANGDFHLQPNSPCVDAGNPEMTDPDGSRIDIGVYGGIQGSLTRPPTIYNIVIRIEPPAALDSVRVNNVGYAVGDTAEVEEGTQVNVEADTVQVVGGRKYTSQQKYPVTFTAVSDTVITLAYTDSVWVEVISRFGTTFGSGWHKPRTLINIGVRPNTVVAEGKTYAFNYISSKGKTFLAYKSQTSYHVSVPDTVEAFWHEVKPAQVKLIVQKPLVGTVEVVPQKDLYTEGDTVVVTYHAPAPLGGQRVTWKGWHGAISSMDTTIIVVAGKSDIMLNSVVEVAYHLHWSTDPASDWQGESWYERGKFVSFTPPDSIVLDRNVYFFNDTLKVNDAVPRKAYAGRFAASMCRPYSIVFFYEFSYQLAPRGDFNGDGVVDEDDFWGDQIYSIFTPQTLGLWRAMSLYHWSPSFYQQYYVETYDLNGDGAVDWADLLLFIDCLDSVNSAKVVEWARSGLTPVEEGVFLVLPAEFALGQNYPNPFNPRTTITYDLPQPSNVILTIYNLMSQPVATLVSSHQEAGHYEAVWDARNLASGVYFYRLHAGEFIETRRMILTR